MCCITGRPGSLWDPLEVAPILPIPTGWIKDEVGGYGKLACPPCYVYRPTDLYQSYLQPRIWDMLGAFFGPGYQDWWFSYIMRPDFTRHHKRHWLVRRSAADPFSRGFVRLDRRQTSTIEVGLGRR